MSNKAYSFVQNVPNRSKTKNKTKNENAARRLRAWTTAVDHCYAADILAIPVLIPILLLLVVPIRIDVEEIAYATVPIKQNVRTRILRTTCLVHYNPEEL